MSEHPHAALVRRGYDAFSRGDMDTLRDEIFTPDIVWHQGGRSQLGGDHKGAEAVVGLFAKMSELTGGTFMAEVHDILASDEHVVALGTTRASRAGRDLVENYCHVCHIRDGRLAEAWIVLADPYTSDEFFGS